MRLTFVALDDVSPLEVRVANNFCPSARCV